MVGIITCDNGHIRLCPGIADVVESDILDAAASCSAVFLIPAHLHLQDTSLMDLFNTYIVEEDILDIIVITTVDRQTALVVNLRLTLTDNIEIIICEVHQTVAYFGIAMQADEDRMGYVNPLRVA